ncbi:hypothetical protein Acr_00g0038860 [Actinidia rufa]|uniref:Uncharacterized protein n=1 Tax=Actinidia rufa TaxID=165716 RepID=A0A7J0DHE7_9ERIC|nr:hypothetical protein Acr_00g0038860 [Actinidia rufa]
MAWGGNQLGGSIVVNSLKASILWALIFSVGELGRQVTVADTSRKHDTYLALAQAVMLPRDVADLAAEDEVTTGSLKVMQNKQKKANALEAELKKVREKLVSTNATLFEECKSSIIVSALRCHKN